MNVKSEQENKMREIKVTKIVLSAGATGTNLDKSAKLLELVSGKKAQIIKSGPKRRIPAFNVKPNMPLGARVTIRGKDLDKVLKRLLAGISNTLDVDQMAKNSFSFGIREYIEIPEIEYQRDIGIRGFNVTIVFERSGSRVKKRKIKRGKYPARQHISKEEIIKFLEDNFDTKFL